jgi:hypothetical protein
VAKTKKRAKSRRRHRAKPEVTVRFANEGGMAKKRKSGKAKRRRNPSNPPRRRRRSAGKRATHRRRRRNPEGFADRAMKLAGGAIVALGTGALVMVGMSKLAPTYPNVAEYGLPAAGFLAGALVYKSHPTLGAGVALGSVAAPFALPLGSKILSATSSTTTPTATPATTAAGIGRAMRAVQLGAVQQQRLGAVQMGRAYRGYG